MTYINNCPVECLQQKDELNALLSIFDSNDHHVVLEIGSFFGGTMWHFLKKMNLSYNFEASGPPIFLSVDLPITSIDSRYNQMIMSKNQWDSWKGIVNLCCFSGRSNDPNIIQSVDNEVKIPGIDFMFIDGSHEYKDVIGDYQNYYRMVKHGGLIAFHDITYSPDVRKAWNEVKDVSVFNMEIKHKDGFGIGILKK